MGEQEDLERHNEEEREAWYAECTRGCNCCPTCWECPCAGCCAGGICDDMRCTCQDEKRDTTWVRQRPRPPASSAASVGSSTGERA